MASDAPLIGLIAPLQKSLFGPGHFLVPFLDILICAVIRRMCPSEIITLNVIDVLADEHLSVKCENVRDKWFSLKALHSLCQYFRGCAEDSSPNCH